MSEDRVARFDLSELRTDLSSLGADLSALRKPPEHSDAPFLISWPAPDAAALSATAPPTPATATPAFAQTAAPVNVPTAAAASPEVPAVPTPTDGCWTIKWLARTPVISVDEGLFVDRYRVWRELRDARPPVPWWGYGYAIAVAPLVISLSAPWFVLQSDPAAPRAGQHVGVFQLFSLLAVLLTGFVAVAWAVKIVTRREFRSMVSGEESGPDPGRWHRMSALSGAACGIAALLWFLSNAGHSDDTAGKLWSYSLSSTVGFWFAGLALVIVAGTWFAHRNREYVEEWWARRQRRRTGNQSG